MKIKSCVKTILFIFLLGLLPLHLYAAEVTDGPSKKTPEPKEEIIKMLKEKGDEGIGEEKVDEGAGEEKVMAAETVVKEDKGRVYFVKGSDALDAKAKNILNETAAWLKDNPDAKLVIEGHGNDYNSRERNLMMGELRGGSVLSYLIKKGIDENRLTVVSYGSERSRNRRIAKAYGVKNWRVCFLVIEQKGKTATKGSVGQQESRYVPTPQKEIEEKEPPKEKEPAKETEPVKKKEPVKEKEVVKVKEPAKEKEAAKKEEPVKVEEPVKKVKKKEETPVVKAKQPKEEPKTSPEKKPVVGTVSQGGDEIAEAKKFFEEFIALGNNFDSKVLDLYSDYAVIYMAGGQNQSGALTLEKAKPILLEALSKAKAQNAANSFSDVTYTMEGKKVRIKSTRNSKPHSMIIGKNAKNEWKIEEEEIQE